MEIMSWVAVGVTAWMALSVPLALLVGTAIRAGARGGQRSTVRRQPAHQRHGLGCAGRRMVRGIA
ncbi:hypothetical protein I4I73_21935 [Pseudonocardia sp. KRD-184]|uniref:Uncharacterized protein n=1 Tax=Pseudonocardia oceani TaxID=2792013 RepID=A0ABS6U7D7_9PSEU|nr:hypothetical protein [Pseudonocardia oceani]MBW0091530.1 hypothetical protein [Pseudonocardia oceani]MBW0098651.1 hypothetical protein [Pseudonocardia oceani]MBW0111192.1 hypothetical protein [Pseudonocardia oceani]MBW0124126.1 hypothetical protein [Pseudonocardia oceani]MBW0128148.1 hypothetical protein [Pseudonocardia oceani]